MADIHLSFDDFCALTLIEFEYVCKAWSDRQEALRRDVWERERLICTLIIQPHVTKQLNPKSLIPLPWDQEQGGGDTLKASQKPMSKEEQQQRFNELTARLGKTF